MSSLEPLSSYNNVARTAIDKAWMVMKASGEALVRNGQKMQVLLANQVQARNQLSLSSLQQISNSTDIAEASQACVSYLTTSSRAQAENIASWSQLLLQSCGALIPAVVARPNGDAGAEPRSHDPGNS